ncbi:MAG: formylglycine-generating enzyme family protein [Cohaesibacter sp.]|nr:formylglycine-generating enzyme family protein [Cohaesibacter sp.]
MVSSETISLIKQALIGFGLVALVLLAQLLMHMRAFAIDVDMPSVRIEPRSFAYRVPGEYLQAGRAVNGPLERRSLSHPLYVMRYQVSVRDYEACVRDGGCSAQWQAYGRADGKIDAGLGHVPVTGVSHDDALSYARWVSEKTGLLWRLPTDLEWAAFAAERYYDDAYLRDGQGVDMKISLPSKARRYGLDAGELPDDADYDPIPKNLGSFGENSLGLSDLSGNIWEWTSSCYMRYRQDETGRLLESQNHCGVYIVQGKVRTYMSGFIRDPSSGGCAVGEPPDNLGFRLVRDAADKDWKSRLQAFFAR